MTEPLYDPAQESRDSPRVMALNLVSYETEDDSVQYEGSPKEGLGRTRNVSEGGLLLEVARPYPLSVVLDLRISLGDRIIAPKARVVRLQELAGNRIEMGLKFVELSPEDRDTIVAYIAENPELGVA